ncbi:MAG: 4-(cytidine 5'-diphospho)-2-C-methyl-D-erythritol kinase [Oscillospiraceae bacterium]|nr:4-(cytidine 5'-diphospho)-2-C-methyl-D-erythritol kinase [Oscillospiraceae bacterium]
MKIREHAYAKLNISLDIIRRMENGYHDMCMIMQSIALCDDVNNHCTRGKGRITASSNISFLPSDRKNIAVKAVETFFAHTGITGYDAHIDLKKRIPVCAGMGGGSSDGAAVLRGLNKLFGAGLNADTLRSLALELGSDVPFCVEGGTALAKGRGELLTPLKDMPQCDIVVCKPPISISTPQLFSKIQCDKIKLRPDTEGMLRAIDAGDLSAVAMRMYNVFEPVLPRNAGQIAEIKSELLDNKALGAVMTGTGSAVFGIFNDRAKARQAYSSLSNKYEECFLTCMQEKINIGE